MIELEQFSCTPVQASRHPVGTGLRWDDRAPSGMVALLGAMAGVAAMALGTPIGFLIAGVLS